MDIEYFIKKLKSLDPTIYQSSPFYPHCVIEEILNYDFAVNCQDEILNITNDLWDRYDNPFEQKWTLRDKHHLPLNCNILFNILTSNEILDILSNIVGVKLYNDPNKNWWGIHKYNNGDYLDIHSDAGIHPVTKQKKHVTLGIYLSKNWKEENKGHLELWDGDNIINSDVHIFKCFKQILPTFNKMIMFTNNNNAWHGNPDPVIINKDETRIFLTISYLSEKHTDGMENNREKAFFIKRPEDLDNIEKDTLRFIRADSNKYKEVYRL
uniref:Prolyl 4-hydroxylase alpha subunit Fe(2+) 2OG dioxygenase domain-containing protein n=1 Tax=viral metagenome TaxID=1070528 RepID=A0A6C0II92_9ZZZZ